jgi:hypothetical protein
MSRGYPTSQIDIFDRDLHSAGLVDQASNCCAGGHCQWSSLKIPKWSRRVRLKRACGVQELHNWFLRQNSIGISDCQAAQTIMDVFQIAQTVLTGDPNLEVCQIMLQVGGSDKIRGRSLACFGASRGYLSKLRAFTKWACVPPRPLAMCTSFTRAFIVSNHIRTYRFRWCINVQKQKKRVLVFQILERYHHN